jgi:DNA-binding response OmpR family regulator
MKTPLRILLVESEPAFAEALARTAGERGHAVHLAPSVSAALADADGYDVLLADIGQTDRWHGKDVLVRLAGAKPVPYVLTSPAEAQDRGPLGEGPAIDRWFARVERDLGEALAQVA